MRYAGAAALVLPLLAGLYLFDFSPARILNGLTRLGTIFSFMFPPYVWTTWQEWSDVLVGLGQTISMAFLGTLLGALAAFPLAFLGAKNIMHKNKGTRLPAGALIIAFRDIELRPAYREPDIPEVAASSPYSADGSSENTS